MLQRKNMNGKRNSLNNNWRVYFKHDGCSMLLFKNQTKVNAKLKVIGLKRMYNDWCGTFVITK